VRCQWKEKKSDEEAKKNQRIGLMGKREFYVAKAGFKIPVLKRISHKTEKLKARFEVIFINWNTYNYNQAYI
jgi:hypothetical protein